jgi:hypothetical protein
MHTQFVENLSGSFSRDWFRCRRLHNLLPDNFFASLAQVGILFRLVVIAVRTPTYD